MEFEPQKHNLIVVAGPTTSGKTDYAIELAKKYNGELINADSRQFYKHLNIGTAKGEITEKDGVNEFVASRVKIHMLNIIDPDEEYNIFDFRDQVFSKIKEIWKHGKTPILVGGSGMYIDIILHPEKYNTKASGLPALRSWMQNLTVLELQDELQRVNKEKLEQMNESDRKNPRRLVRAIEISLQKDVKISSKQNYLKLSPFVTLLDPNMTELEKKIEKRVEQMFANGFVEEVKKVLSLGFNENCSGIKGSIGYSLVIDYIKGKITLNDCIAKVKHAHRQYAKKQKTWFKKYLKPV